MVNYDLPWNPNRLEQRFGRIHRINQQEVCHLWNLVAKETREGEVYFRLLEKLRVESEALNGRVFDILGEVFEGTSLKALLLQAIRYGDQPDVRARLGQRVEHAKELMAMRHVTSATPVAVGGALVVPAGLLRRRRGEPPVEDGSAFSTNPAARRRIERLAMDAVRRVEEARGCRVVDVSAQKCGWDLTAYPPVADGKQPDARHIEVKGRVQGAGTVTITRNEMLYALNQADKFLLAIVLVGENDTVDGPYYLRHPFEAEPGWGVASINFEIKALLERAEKTTS
jgi:hypothetical protein